MKLNEPVYSVYWIRWELHNDIYSEGYVGISKNVPKRMKDHLKPSSKSKISDVLRRYNLESIRVDVIVSDLTYSQALIIEEMLRPTGFIGWNVQKGGYVPH